SSIRTRHASFRGRLRFEGRPVRIAWPAAVERGSAPDHSRAERPASATRSLSALTRTGFVRVGVPAVLLALLFVPVRYWVARSPALSETYYDEALTGSLSLAILRGIPQVSYWGLPYLGADGASVAAGSFFLSGPS